MENSIEFVAFNRKLLRVLNRINKALSDSDYNRAKNLVDELIEDTRQDITTGLDKNTNLYINGDKKRKVKIDMNSVQDATAESVIEAVGEYYGIAPEKIISRDRASSVVRARQISMYLLNSINMPFYEIGSTLGGRDHATIIHAVNKIKDEIEIDMQLKQQIGEIKGLLSDKGYVI